jgi:hypothetical protein
VAKGWKNHKKRSLTDFQRAGKNQKSPSTTIKTVAIRRPHFGMMITVSATK